MGAGAEGGIRTHGRGAHWWRAGSGRLLPTDGSWNSPIPRIPFPVRSDRERSGGKVADNFAKVVYFFTCLAPASCAGRRGCA